MPEPITAEALGALQGDSFRSVLPADFAAKPYMKDVNSIGDLVKKFDGSQTLLGQRNVPADDATDEQWLEFHAKAGRPAKPEDYPLPEIEGVPKDFIDKSGKLLGLQQLLHQIGASKFQAKKFFAGFLKQAYLGEKAATDIAAKQKEKDDVAFNQTLNGVFGADREKIVENGKKYLAGYLPESVKPLFEKLDANSLAVVLAVTDGIVKKFSGEDPFRGGSGGGGGGGAETMDQLKTQMTEIMKDPAYSDPFKDKNKNKELNDKMEVIRGKMRKLMGAA